MAQLSDTRIYPIVEGRQVRLQVEIGNGQAGGSSIIWEGTITEVFDQPFTVPLGGETLQFKTLHCATVVRDVSPDTNRTIVTYHLTGGIEDRDYPYAMEVEEHGGHAKYLVDFVFV